MLIRKCPKCGRYDNVFIHVPITQNQDGTYRFEMVLANNCPYCGSFYKDTKVFYKKLLYTVLVQQTRHWLEDYPESLKQYNSAATKIEGGIFERNALDDLRLALELLLKSLLENQKSLENQISDLGKMLENAGVSKELRNLLLKTIDYYCKYNNSHVKHDDNINQNEIDFIFEETTIIMKLLVKLFNN